VTQQEYNRSRELLAEDVPFAALIMAAIGKANREELKRLERAFPDTFREAEARERTPGAYLPGEYEALREVDDLEAAQLDLYFESRIDILQALPPQGSLSLRELHESLGMKRSQVLALAWVLCLERRVKLIRKRGRTVAVERIS
jgi:hypothetical protein